MNRTALGHGHRRARPFSCPQPRDEASRVIHERSFMFAAKEVARKRSILHPRRNTCASCSKRYRVYVTQRRATHWLVRPYCLCVCVVSALLSFPRCASFEPHSSLFPSDQSSIDESGSRETGDTTTKKRRFLGIHAHTPHSTRGGHITARNGFLCNGEDLEFLEVAVSA